jgi:perosamine synthetase
MKKNNIKMAGPWITDHEKQLVSKMMDTGWDNYEYVEEFEDKFAKWHDRKFCLITTCGTHAIHLLLIALGICKNDEVIVPDCTWTGSVAPVTYTGATPVFVDIDKDNWCIDINSIRKNITPKTKAILFVDLFGNFPNIEMLNSLSKEFNIPLIEDSAEALGSKYKGIRAGKFGVGSIHSFHRTKTIATGEGGALLIDDPKLFKRAKFLRDHGRSSTIPYFIEEATPKYMPSNIQASLALGQFQRIDELIERKRNIFKRYKKNFSDIKDIQFNLDNEEIYNGAWATTLVIGESYNIKAIEIINRLSKKNIPARPFFYPLTSMPAYKMFALNSNPNCASISSRGITLAAHYLLKNDEIDLISQEIISILK